MKYVALPHFTKVENKIVKTCAIVVFKKHIPVKVSLSNFVVLHHQYTKNGNKCQEC